jgi:alkanesulfonate monooxygenase SsuD/methylene tetrahydromethanopterin reductase-like flavin-dependent oxidoreductase (luciferase family)
MTGGTMELKDIIYIAIAIFTSLGFGAAIGNRLAWHFKPPVQKEIDKQTLDNLAADAAKRSREELDYYFKTLAMSVTSLRRQNQEQAAAMAILSQQNKDQQAQIDELKLDQVEKQAQIDDLRTDQDEIKAAFEALEWSVRQEPDEVVERIETRAQEKRGKKL